MGEARQIDPCAEVGLRCLVASHSVIYRKTAMIFAVVTFVLVKFSVVLSGSATDFVESAASVAAQADAKIAA